MTAIVAAIAVVWAPARSQASFVLRIDFGNDGTYEHVITDNTAGDLSLTLGRILVDVTNGSMDTTNTGVSKPILSNGVIDLNSITVRGAGVVAIELTDTGFTAAPGGYVFSVGGTTSENPANISFQGGGTTSNTEFDLTTSTGVLPGVGTGGTSFAANGIFGGPGAVSPYSLTIRAVITHDDANDSTSFDAELRPVPAPAGLVLAATGLPFLGLLRRRLRRTETATAV